MLCLVTRSGWLQLTDAGLDPARAAAVLGIGAEHNEDVGVADVFADRRRDEPGHEGVVGKSTRTNHQISGGKNENNFSKKKLHLSSRMLPGGEADLQRPGGLLHGAGQHGQGLLTCRVLWQLGLMCSVWAAS